MRKGRRTKKDSTARVATVPWEVVAVHALPRHRLYVQFVDGNEGEIDVRSFVFSRRPGVFKALQDRREFVEAFVQDGAVTWPNGLDMAPDAMYDDILGHTSRAKR